MILLVILSYIVLLVLYGVRPHRSSMSKFELARRLEKKDPDAKQQWRREETWRDIAAFRQVLTVLLSVCLVAALIAEYGWMVGMLLATLLLLLAMPLSAFRPIRQNVSRLYDRYEAYILPRVQLIQDYVKPFRGVFDEESTATVQSREEFMHLVGKIDQLLTTHERKMIDGVMTFDDKLIQDFMVPRSMMDVVGAHELLGPLVLDDLHKTGHSHFPVFDGDIDHIIGILHIHSLFNLDNKKSRVVKDVMEPNVYYIREDQTLADALAACIKKRRHLLVVINEFRETVGIITIEDAVEQLIGQKIVDQFDRHDDLRTVAARNPRGNNTHKTAVDI